MDVGTDDMAKPSGVVTFLFTDIEGSTRRWEADAEAMRVALEAHNEVLREAVEAHHGTVFNTPATGCARCSPHRGPQSMPQSPRNGHWSCRCGWASPPAKPSCAEATTSAWCSIAQRE